MGDRLTAHQNNIMGIRPVFVALAFAHDFGCDDLRASLPCVRALFALRATNIGPECL